MSRVLFVFLALSVAACVAQKYSSKYDSIDIDNILSNKRILNSYIKCILSKGPCSPEGRELRRDIPDALKDSCAKCTDSQKKIIKKASKHLMENSPKDWQEISNHFDPAGKYKQSFLKFLNES